VRVRVCTRARVYTRMYVGRVRKDTKERSEKKKSTSAKNKRERETGRGRKRERERERESLCVRARIFFFTAALVPIGGDRDQGDRDQVLQEEEPRPCQAYRAAYRVAEDGASWGCSPAAAAGSPALLLLPSGPAAAVLRVPAVCVQDKCV